MASAVLVTAGNLARMGRGKAEPGQTTEFTALVMYGVGAWVVVGSMPEAIVLGGVVALLLHLREPLHEFAGRMGEKDIRAIMQFVLIALVILPILPDRAFGPYGVLNPYQIWWMVVLIVGLSLLGYVAFKLLGAGKGMVLAGLLGGLISSTATTVSYARRTKEDPGSSRLAALVVMIASAVVFARLLVEIAAVAFNRFLELAPPILAMLGLAVVLSAVVWFGGRKGTADPPEPENPAELKPAIAFGLLYAAILLAVAPHDWAHAEPLSLWERGRGEGLEGRTPSDLGAMYARSLTSPALLSQPYARPSGRGGRKAPEPCLFRSPSLPAGGCEAGRGGLGE